MLCKVLHIASTALIAARSHGRAVGAASAGNVVGRAHRSDAISRPEIVEEIRVSSGMMVTGLHPAGLNPGKLTREMQVRTQQVINARFRVILRHSETNFWLEQQCESLE